MPPRASAALSTAGACTGAPPTPLLRTRAPPQRSGAGVPCALRVPRAALQRTLQAARRTAAPSFPGRTFRGGARGVVCAGGGRSYKRGRRARRQRHAVVGCGRARRAAEHRDKRALKFGADVPLDDYLGDLRPAALDCAVALPKARACCCRSLLAPARGRCLTAQEDNTCGQTDAHGGAGSLQLLEHIRCGDARGAAVRVPVIDHGYLCRANTRKNVHADSYILSVVITPGLAVGSRVRLGYMRSCRHKSACSPLEHYLARTSNWTLTIHLNQSGLSEPSLPFSSEVEIDLSYVWRLNCLKWPEMALFQAFQTRAGLLMSRMVKY